MDILQNIAITLCRARPTALQMRILTAIVKECNLINAEREDTNALIFYIRAADLLAGSKHYERLQGAFHTLQERVVFEIRDANGYYSAPLISEVENRAGSGLYKVTIPRRLYTIISDVTTNGYHRYNYENALALPTATAMRLYMLFSGAQRPLTIKIDTLRAWFTTPDKYKQTRDFLLKVIEPARAALESKGINGFSYSPIYKYGRIYALQMRPIHRESEDMRILSRVNTSSLLPPRARAVLISQLHFTARELGANKATWALFDRVTPDRMMRFVEDTAAAAAYKQNPKGYFIAAVRRAFGNLK